MKRNLQPDVWDVKNSYFIYMYTGYVLMYWRPVLKEVVVLSMKNPS